MCFSKTALTCLAILACIGRSGDPTSNSLSSASDPVADYTKLIDSEIKRVENIKFSEGKRVEAIKFSEGKIDVQKTDSLEWPLKGTYNCTFSQQINLGNDGKMVNIYEAKMTHGLQGEEWVMITGEAKQLRYIILEGNEDVLEKIGEMFNGRVLEFRTFDELSP